VLLIQSEPERSEADMTTERQLYHFPSDLYYESQTYLWVRIEGEIATIGLTALALETFGDIAYISTIKAGTPIERGQMIGSVEAAKMVGDLVAPISGEIMAFNEEVQRNPGLINADPYGAGWLVRVRPSAWDRDSEALLHGPTLEKWIKEQPGGLEQ
jgi:glycine cleavage system H protein